jgi:microcystin-dependent protein
MAEPFIGEIRMVGFNYAPSGWANADGQLMPIQQNPTLYALYSTIYGGDGRTTFALPDLRGRVPIHTGQGPGQPSYPIGSYGGVASVTLATAQMPTHDHTITVKGSDGRVDSKTPLNSCLAVQGSNFYTSAAPDQNMHTGVGACANAGGSNAHENRQPYLAIRFCVSLTGIWPSRP